MNKILPHLEQQTPAENGAADDFLDWWTGATSPCWRLRLVQVPGKQDSWVMISFQKNYPDMSIDAVYLDYIQALSPSYGDGSAVLKLICEKADEFGTILILKAAGQIVRPSCGGNPRRIVTKKRRLKAWYKKFDFVHHGPAIEDHMIRYPNIRDES